MKSRLVYAFLIDLYIFSHFLRFLSTFDYVEKWLQWRLEMKVSDFPNCFAINIGYTQQIKMPQVVINMDEDVRFFSGMLIAQSN